MTRLLPFDKLSSNSLIFELACWREVCSEVTSQEEDQEGIQEEYSFELWYRKVLVGKEVWVKDKDWIERNARTMIVQR